MVDELLAFYNEDGGGSNESELEDLQLQNAIKLTRDNIKAIIMVCAYLPTINLTFSFSFFLKKNLRLLNQQLKRTSLLERMLRD